MSAFSVLGKYMVFHDITLSFGNVRFGIRSAKPLELDEAFLDFRTDDGRPDVKVFVDWDWANARKPQTEIKGQDLLGHYHVEPDGTRFLMTRGGYKGYIACTRYDSSYRELYCTVNAAPFLEPPTTWGSILRFLPIRGVLLRFNTLFFHASQIRYKNRGILFTAPSGTGKSTQARLWRDCKGAEIVCNDRTLVRKTAEGWYTYGYPLDGSEPVRSTSVNKLGAIVVLRQGTDCNLQPLNGAKAVRGLMEQLVMDTWSSDARAEAVELLLGLLNDIPVYLYSCTPDEAAVRVLEERLNVEGVL